MEELKPEDVAANAWRWIDMVILKLMEIGILDLRAAGESKLLKMKKQKQRRAKTEMKSRLVVAGNNMAIGTSCNSRTSKM